MPLDLDSSPWRRWSPILFDVVIVALLIHVENALLHAFYPTGMDAGAAVPRVVRFFAQLATPGLLHFWWWGLAVLTLLLLIPVRAAISIAGWHRLTFFPVALALPAAGHFYWLDRIS